MDETVYGSQVGTTTFLGRDCKSLEYHNVSWELDYYYTIDLDTNLVLYSDIIGTVTEVTLFDTTVTSFAGVTLP
jgi:hypothetical protein